MTERPSGIRDTDPQVLQSTEVLSDLDPSEQTATSVTGGGEPSGTGQDEGPAG